MRILTFDDADGQRLGVRDGDEVIDLAMAAPDLPRDMAALLRGGATALARVAAVADDAGDAHRRAHADLTLLPPVTAPGKILCVGRNYAAHAAEGGKPPPTYPEIFCRHANSLVAHGQPIVRPTASHNLDYEGELVAIIGSRCRHATKDNALDQIAGYSLFNDGSVRDYQRKASQWTMGKNFDRTGAFGPEMVTADELPAGCKGLRLQTRINGTVLQDANTDDMIFDVATLVVELSTVMTLEPGDVIVTGTPEGVGYPRTPPIWMKPGDTVEIEVDRVGVLRNSVIDE